MCPSIKYDNILAACLVGNFMILTFLSVTSFEYTSFKLAVQEIDFSHKSTLVMMFFILWIFLAKTFALTKIMVKCILYGI